MHKSSVFTSVNSHRGHVCNQHPHLEIKHHHTPGAPPCLLPATQPYGFWMLNSWYGLVWEMRILHKPWWALRLKNKQTKKGVGELFSRLNRELVRLSRRDERLSQNDSLALQVCVDLQVCEQWYVRDYDSLEHGPCFLRFLQKEQHEQNGKSHCLGISEQSGLVYWET